MAPVKTGDFLRGGKSVGEPSGIAEQVHHFFNFEVLYEVMCV